MAALLLAAAPTPASAAGLKVAIIVGPTGTQTAGYRSDADSVAAAATAAGASVVKVYSPNATWANVRAAVNGANIIVWMGHGNGYPNPYNATETTSKVNGWGLNRTTTHGDGDNWGTQMVYCGEKALLGTVASSDIDQWQYCGGSTNTDGIHPAPGFVMLYAHACYTAGAGEPGESIQAQATLLSRVKNYSYPVLKLGAGAYFATEGGASMLVSTILTNPSMAYGDVFKSGGGFSASALKAFSHADMPGDSIWLQSNGYHYAFAGNPSATFGTAGPWPAGVEHDRYAGADRFATATAVSAAQFAPGVPVAYVATGSNFPDALAGGSVAAYGGGPVLLVTATTIPAATATELQRLRPVSIVLLGGEQVVGPEVMAALVPYAIGGSVTRLSGANRYETAASISAATYDPGVAAVYIATGANFPDALAGVPATGVANGPVLLVGADGIPDTTAAELTRLAPARIVILGGSSVVSDAIATELASYTAAGGTVDRLAGADRYATSVAISASSFPTSDVVFVATGWTFPDALGGGPVAAIQGGPLLLVSSTKVPASVASELQRLHPHHVVFLGGTSVLSQSVVDQVGKLLGG